MQDENRIRNRAYEIWEREGRPHGRDREHWHQARREIDDEGRASAGGKDDPAGRSAAARMPGADDGRGARAAGATSSGAEPRGATAGGGAGASPGAGVAPGSARRPGT
jgi:hypothetical protein